MSGSDIHQGGCQCGAVRYEIEGALENSHVCHCRMCQRATGGLFAALAGTPKDRITWTRQEPAFYESSNLAKRGFCPRCGTPLTFAFNDPKARLYVTIGSLDEPEAAPVRVQYGTESKLSFVSFCEDLPQEITGGTPEAEEFFANMKSNQYTD